MKVRTIVLLVLVAVLGVGTAIAYTHRNAHKGEVVLAAEEKKEVRRQEETLALFLVNNFEDIKKIEFVSISKGGFGRPRFIYFLINDKLNISTDLRDNYDIQDYGLSYHNSSEILKQKRTPTTFSNLSETKIEVIYYGEDE